MIKIHNETRKPSIATAVDEWLTEKTGVGVSKDTLRSYRSAMNAIANRVDFSMPVEKLNQKIVSRLVVQLESEEKSAHTIESYVRTICVFVSWCKKNGWTDETIQRYHAPETVKDTYSDEDLMKLLVKPNMNRCTFPEYRTWVIINLVMNNGCRAGTIRNILIKDINFDMGYILTRHNKNGHIQSMPMSSQLIEVLKEYLSIRKGSPEDYLFCNEEGEQLTQNALRLSVKRYNRKRGVRDTSIHQFRHTFAKKYLLDCGGDAFTLQKLMGHSTLEMTRHYCNIYDVELARNYDARSPLTQMSRKVGKGKPITMR